MRQNFQIQKWFSKRGITQLILKMNFDDVTGQPMYFSIGYPVLAPHDGVTGRNTQRFKRQLLENHMTSSTCSKFNLLERLATDLKAKVSWDCCKKNTYIRSRANTNIYIGKSLLFCIHAIHSLLCLINPVSTVWSDGNSLKIDAFREAKATKLMISS